MNCNEARQQLDALEQFDEIDATRDLVSHLNECQACYTYARDRQLVSLLASLPVPQPVPGFEDRVLRNALSGAVGKHTHLHIGWALATAASLVLAVFLTVQYYPVDDPRQSLESVQSTVIEVQPLETRVVNLLLTSPRDLTDALITVELNDNVEIGGRAGIDRLQWHTNIKTGANQLSLPIRLLEGGSGMVTVILEHGGSDKRFSVTVNAVQQEAQQKAQQKAQHTFTMA